MKKFLGIVCFIYSGLIIYVCLSNKLKYFLAPQMSIYLKLSVIPLILMGFVLIFNNKLHYKFKISDIVLLLPIIMLILAGDGKLSLNFASSRIDTSSLMQKKSEVKKQNNTGKQNEKQEEKIEEDVTITENDSEIKEKEQEEKVDIYFDVNDQSYNVLISYLTYTDAAHKYEGKTIRVRGFSLTNTYLPSQYFMLGKYLISCCAADAAYNGFIVKYDINKVKNNTWYEIEGKLKIGKDLEGYEFMYIDVTSIKEIDSKMEEEYVYPCYVYDNGACQEVNKYNLEY